MTHPNPITATGLYLTQTISELRKTVTPTGRQLTAWSMGVLAFVGMLMLAVTGMDLGLGRLTLLIFG
ncbi:preprotein translocase subunit SecE [Bifidobacterium saguini]|nr:preprotein translocase subunit SecE [Bifidobacterium saguini]